jgi:hypothetical protein
MTSNIAGAGLARVTAIEVSPIAWRARQLPPRVAFALTESVAAREDRRAVNLIRETREDLDSEIAVAAADSAHVVTWLRKVEAQPGDMVVLSWSETDGAIMLWDEFTRNWQHICYPGADECTILPATNDSWIIEWSALWCKFWMKKFIR